ncbi:class I SAM-dependent methyltransferase [Cyanobacteria bacterium FACHB-472]|nr:class I SAM-dependent methyltransferase [Cyanobacteria bacterium FACHB-472]
MTEIKNVSGTAFIIAELRVEGSEENNPLYTDEIVKLFLNDETKKIAKEIAKTFPPAKDMVKIRTKYFDDVLSNQISLGYQQVVILGSGLDTRAVRKGTEDVVFFEIDNQNTLLLKEESLKQNQISANVKYISGDYIKDDLIALLARNKFDFNLPTYFLWEGNITYLTEDEIIFVVKQIRDNVKEFKLSLDYFTEGVILRTTGYQDINDYRDELEKMGAPWLTGFANIDNFAKKLNLKVSENFSTADLYKRYRPHSSLESNIFDFYFVCTLES